MFLHYSLEYAERKTPGLLSFEGFWTFLEDTGHTMCLTMEGAADIFCVVVFWQSSDFVQRRMKRMQTSVLLNKDDIKAYYSKDQASRPSTPAAAAHAMEAFKPKKAGSHGSFMLKQVIRSRGWNKMKVL